MPTETPVDLLIVTRAKVPSTAVINSEPVCCLQSRRHAQTAAQAVAVPLWQPASQMPALLRLTQLFTRAICQRTASCMRRRAVHASVCQAKSPEPDAATPSRLFPAPSLVSSSQLKRRTQLVRVNRAATSAIPVPALVVAEQPAPLHRQQLPAVAGTANSTEVSPLSKSFFVQAPRPQCTRADATLGQMSALSQAYPPASRAASVAANTCDQPAAALHSMQTQRMLAELARWHAQGCTVYSPTALPTSANRSAVDATAKGKQRTKTGSWHMRRNRLRAITAELHASCRM
jgi:hypothetical protein